MKQVKRDVFRKLGLGVSLLLVSSLLGCSRDLDGDQSKIVIQTPKNGSLSSKATAANVDVATACFAVEVRGNGIQNRNSACGLRVGVHSQFVQGGGVLELSVPRGDNRTVQLYVYEPLAGQPCPKFEPLNCSDSKLCQTYQAGSATGVNMQAEEVTVDITLDVTETSFGAAGGVCGAAYVAQLLTNGQVFSKDGVLLNANHAYMSVRADSGAIDYWFEGGVSSLNLRAPSYVFSITSAPGSQDVYGLVGNNKLVALDGSGGVSDIAPGACPFATCDVPPWMQSISAGGGGKLFGLDSSGGLFELTAAGPVNRTQIPQYVKQVAF